MCSRAINSTAIPGLEIGPVCAKQRGLMPERARRPRLFDVRHTTPDPAQIDWVELINAGRLAGESRVA
jgi:hypothetical protein